MAVSAFALFANQADGLTDSTSVGNAARCPVTWSAPVALRTASGEWGYVHAPQLIESRRGLIMLGVSATTSVSSGDSTVSHDGISVGFALRGDESIAAPIPNPVLGHRVLWPRGRVATDGALEVVWAEADDSSRHSWPIRRLRFARFDGSSWSTPVTLVEGSDLRWSSTSSLVQDGSDGLLLAVSDNSEMSQAVVVVRRSGDHWLSTRVPVGAASGYAAVQPERGGTWVVTFVSASRGQRHDRNSLFVSISRDRGASWSTPVKIHSGGRNGVFDPDLEMRSDSSLVLMWSQDAEDNPDADSEVVSVLAGAGSALSRRSAVAAPGGITPGDRATSATSSVFGVLYTSRERSQMQYLEWDGLQWRRCAVPFQEPAFGLGLLLRRGRGVAAWSSENRLGHGAVVLVTQVVRLRW